MNIWSLQTKPSNVNKLFNLREKLRRYPRPFSVSYFVEHLIVRDANGSECYRFASEVADALNLIAESTDHEEARGDDSR